MSFVNKAMVINNFMIVFAFELTFHKKFEKEKFEKFKDKINLKNKCEQLFAKKLQTTTH